MVIISLLPSNPAQEINSREKNSNQKNLPSAEVDASITVEPTKSTETLYKVLDIVDGDTVKVEINGKTETLRLIGIDTPEIKDPRKPIECFALEASNKAKEILSGKSIKLEADNSQGDKDKYNRELRYILLEDNANFNKLMISEGYAYEYTYNKPYKFQKEFKEAQENAMKAQKGLWNPSACNGLRITPSPVPTILPTSAFIPTVPPKANIIISPVQKPISLPITPIISQTPAPLSATQQCKYSCTGPDRDCKDFSSHSEAQEFFNCCNFSATNDPMRLDTSRGVGNGLACESLR
jgi:endonuclease YncB( thermonuclease family)